MQKKENTKYKDEIEEFKAYISERKEDEEQIDINKYGNENNDKTNMPPLPQSKLMQTRLDSQANNIRPPRSSLGGAKDDAT